MLLILYIENEIIKGGFKMIGCLVIKYVNIFI